MVRSIKPIKNLDDLVGSKRFIIPREFANEGNFIYVGVGGKPYRIITEEAVEIPYEAYCVLRDIGVPLYSFSEEKEFDPWA